MVRYEPAVILHVVRGDLHRRLRSIRETPREAVGVLLLGILLVGVTAGGGAGAYAVGRELGTAAASADVAVRSRTRAVVGLVWVGITVTVAVRTVTKVGDLEQPALHLSSTSIPNLVAATVLAEAVLVASWLVVPTAVVGSAFALGVGSASVLAVLAVATPLVVLAAVSSGVACGLAVRHLLSSYEPLARLKIPLGIVLALAYVSVFVTGRVDSVITALSRPVQFWPVSWLADGLVVGVPGLEPAFVPPAAVGGVGVGFTVALTGVGVAAAVRIGTVHWLSDSSYTNRAVVGRGWTTVGLERLLVPVTTRRTRVVATTVWRRTKRAPMRLVYLLYPLFFAIEPLRRAFESVQTTGELPTLAAPVLMGYVVWASGMAFTLNPLGDQGATLPTTLSVPEAARAVVRGRLLVAVVATAPPGLAFVGLAAAFSPLSIATSGAVLVATAVGVVATAALATGIGVAFPRFGAVSVTRNRRVVVPSKTAAVGYSLSVLVCVGALTAVVLEPIRESIAAALTSPIGPMAALPVDVLAAGLVLAVASVPVCSYRYAVSRIERYRLA